jgi:hypothetical protein
MALTSTTIAHPPFAPNRFVLLHRVAAAAAAVMNCLQDFREEIRSDACKSQVHKYVELAAQDIRFDVPLADACYNDRMTLCAAVPPVSCWSAARRLLALYVLPCNRLVWVLLCYAVPQCA